MLNKDVNLEYDILDNYASETSIINQQILTVENSSKELDTERLPKHFQISQNFTDSLEGISENGDNITVDETQLRSELEKIKDERQQLIEENLGLQGDLKELEGERDKLARVIGIMKTEWEKQYQKLQMGYQKLQIDFKESEINRIALESQLSELRQEYDKLEKPSSRVEEITDRLQEVENQKSALSKVFESQMKVIAAEREGWQQRETELTDHQKSINNALKKRESEVKTLRQELNVTLADKQTMKQKLIEVGKEKMLVDGRIRELESEKKKFGEKLLKLTDEKGKLTNKLTDSKKQLDKNKAQIAALAKKLAEADVEQQKIIQTFEKSMAQSEKTCANLRNKLNAVQKENEQLIQGNIVSFKRNVSEISFETNDKISSDSSTTETLIDKDNDNTINPLTLEQRIIELENSLKLSKSDCDRLNEKLAQIQVEYLNAVNDKDQLTLVKRESDKKVKALEAQLESVGKEHGTNNSNELKINDDLRSREILST
ncbi:13539_t:CDS:2 [Cetraspora pellucida]|uniref:13539_t:CDS:1 n=1 Tax=Cetraspora pellucida TaxID=1433469 RepID=A0A9N9GUP6_9GLOM|nr:13539_t:CDS:2 [Cetraspora pellucida]